MRLLRCVGTLLLATSMVACSGAAQSPSASSSHPGASATVGLGSPGAVESRKITWLLSRPTDP